MQSLILRFASICIANAQQMGGLITQGGTLKCAAPLEICHLRNNNLTALLTVPRKDQLNLAITINLSIRNDHGYYVRILEDDILRYHFDKNITELTLVTGSPILVIDATHLREQCDTFSLTFALTRKQRNFTWAACPHRLDLSSNAHSHLEYYSLHWPLPPPLTFRCLTSVFSSTGEPLMLEPITFNFYGDFELSQERGPRITLNGIHPERHSRYVFDNTSSVLITYQADIAPLRTGFYFRISALSTTMSSRSRRSVSRETPALSPTLRTSTPWPRRLPRSIPSTPSSTAVALPANWQNTNVFIPSGTQTRWITPNYPDPYDNEDHQEILFHITKPRIDIEFQAFSTEFGSDYLLIYDGNVTHPRYILSGHNMPPPIRTRGNVVIFRWKMDREISGFGILAHLTPTGRAYKAISRRCYLRTQVNTTHPSTSLTSPLWPKIYPENEQCFHNLEVSDSGVLTVRFQHFLTLVKVQTLTIWYTFGSETRSFRLSGQPLNNSLVWTTPTPVNLTFAWNARSTSRMSVLSCG